MTQTGKNKMEKTKKSQFSINGSTVDVALSLYDHDKNAARDLEVFYSRLCLESMLPEDRKLLKLEKPNNESLNKEVLKRHYGLNAHFRFDVLKELGTGSLSHTRGLAGFALCSDGLGIGLDLEWQDRFINPASARLFKNGSDESHFFADEKSLLSLWCIKEAAFKALSLDGAIQKTHEHPVLSHIYIKGNQFFHQFDQNLQGVFLQEIICEEGREFLLTLALKKEI